MEGGADHTDRPRRLATFGPPPHPAGLRFANRDNGRVDDAFLAVVIGVSLLAIVGALIALATSGGSYDHIGRDGIEPVRAETPGEDVAELRELLEARNARRVARGEPPIDVEAELSRRLREM
jgi:hypothetical protein